MLQCVSASVDLLGDRLRPHLPTICAALPQVWGAISQRQQQGVGGLARLHSALISTGGWVAVVGWVGWVGLGWVCGGE